MRLPPAVVEVIARQGWGTVTAAQPVGGGCISNGQVLATSTGHHLFLKLNPEAPADMFAREVEGLEALASAPGAPRVPQPYAHGPDFLLLEYLAPGPPGPGHWRRLGEALARQHLHTQHQFGFYHDNYIGATPQPNPWVADGFSFYAEHRLLAMGTRVRAAGLMDAATVRRIERLCARLRDLVPPQPASLLHGDLWSGNIIPGPSGEACLIDPAAYYGWAEADLAMTVLFGRSPPELFAGYETVRSLAPGYRDRFDLYNLYHLLNHVALFGEGYLAPASAILARFA